MRSCPAVLLLLAAALPGLGAAEAPSIPPAPALTQPPAPRPFLGVQIDPTKVQQRGAFDAGVAVQSVVPGSTAATMGVQGGDLIQVINGHPIASMEDLQHALAPMKVGDPVSVDVLRAGAKKTFTGVLAAKPAPPPSLAQQLHDLQQEVERLRAETRHPPDLAETLGTLVKELEDLKRDLPQASAAFKQLYPNGEFSVQIAITITSDKTAPHPLVIGNGPAPISPSGSASASTVAPPTPPKAPSPTP